jgi:inhibitor of cysteine peptidase
VLLHAASAVATEAGKVEAGKVTAMPSLTEADNDRTVELRVGETVRLTLPENATTGYRWAIDRVDGGLIEAAGPEPHYPAGAPPGSGGDVAFTFKATKAGTADVALKYWRHFEGDSSIANRFHVRIHAKP